VTRVECQHRFAVPVETGFAFITDVKNWPRYWPGFLRMQPNSRWSAPGDQACIAVRLLGREFELRMALRRFEKNRLITYTSVQEGAPDAHHERHFVPVDGGFIYRLVVEYEPRTGLPGLYDRVLLRWGIGRALRETITNLDATLSK